VSALNVRLPDSLHDQVRELAERDHISINQFIALAVAEKVSSLVTLEYVKQRMLRGDREKFEKVLAKINAADTPPDDADRLPEGSEVRLPLR
jgi:hypothetical protein